MKKSARFVDDAPMRANVHAAWHRGSHALALMRACLSASLRIVVVSAAHCERQWARARRAKPARRSH
ncbi:hypothetical protein C0Z16_16095 [Paraburkholderia rhynchosiae]|uniref:Uncharacterized protein n=1 Tax=Paraburkholderia rhynchosiae TaxID=487049 RepID=A0ABX4V409_9BURK|nr:hypothetical protein C0Z16_16095 [Paraburkholderia rhynchosiae]